MVTFHTMTTQEAKAFLATFIDGTPERIDELRTQCATSGGPTPDVLDLSPESLDPLWEWARRRLSWREGYVPPLHGRPGPTEPPGELETLDQLPEWFNPLLGDWRFSAPTLWLIDGMARYLGETLISNVAGARWTVGNAWTKAYVYRNRPVVSGLPGPEVEPMCRVTVVVGRALRPDRPASTLRDIYTTSSSPEMP